MPKFKRYRSDKLTNINVRRYAVDWCGKCRSKFQFEVKTWLKQFWRFDLCCEEMAVPGTRCWLDFVNLSKKIIVETNGEQHANYNSFFHKNNRFNFHSQIVRDESKREWAADNGFIFVEIETKDLPLTTDFFKENYGIELCRV